jgi:hypothetical protein
MEIEIPTFRKRINAFLVGEEGKISKHSLLAIGTVLGTVALSNAASAACCKGGSTPCHTNNFYTNPQTDGSSYKAIHGHHSSHGSHGSHSNHTNHGSHGNHGNY